VRLRLARRVATLGLTGLVSWTVAGCFIGGSSAPDAAGGDAAATDGDGPGPCPSDLPASCPGPAPSFPNDVTPIMTTRCTSCHGPSGPEANHDFTTYDGVYAERATILSQVYSCRMPPAGAPELAGGERAILLAWLVCGAPSQ
jgi:hypothetical protein